MIPPTSSCWVDQVLRQDAGIDGSVLHLAQGIQFGKNCHRGIKTIRVSLCARKEQIACAHKKQTYVQGYLVYVLFIRPARSMDPSDSSHAGDHRLFASSQSAGFRFVSCVVPRLV